MSKITTPLPHNPPERLRPVELSDAYRSKSFIWTALALSIIFGLPLYQIVRFASSSDLYSHTLLVPFVSIYFVWLNRSQLDAAGPRLTPAYALAFFGSSIALLAVYWLSQFSAISMERQDSLALAVYSLVLLLAGICCWFFSLATLRVLAFPLAFLVFMAPFPLVVEQSLETFLQHGSAWVAHSFFSIIGTPVFRDGTLFQLPGFRMQVAPECSGIHSTLALFITSIVAGQVLLRSNRNRAILAVVVLPIALLRNGLRVTTIGELCVRIGPEMIDSYIHRHGGPVFFALSLVPFSLVLLFLLKIDRKKIA